MPTQRTVTIYQFDELPDNVKEKIIREIQKEFGVSKEDALQDANFSNWISENDCGYARTF